jgi:hypothetical protein
VVDSDDDVVAAGEGSEAGCWSVTIQDSEFTEPIESSSGCFRFRFPTTLPTLDSLSVGVV